MSARLNQIADQLNYPQGLLAGQVAIITGSGQGIGAECARLFANAGAKVVVSDIDGPKAEAVAESINSAGGKALAVPGDLLEDDYRKELVQKAAEFGGGKIHILVNNAGFGVLQTTYRYWDLTVALHNTVPFKLIREAGPFFRLKDGEPRSIVNISPTPGIHRNPGQLNYTNPFIGAVGTTQFMAKAWGPAFGVRANTVSLGHTETRLTGAEEALGIPAEGKPADGAAPLVDMSPRMSGPATEAASVILDIVSPLSSYINGQMIEVTGRRNIRDNM